MNAKTTVASRPGRSKHNQNQRALAHKRFDQMLDDAESGRLFGRVGIEMTCEDGRFIVVHRTLNGSDR